MEVLSHSNQSSDEWRHSSLDESWDSRLPTPLALNFSGDEEEFTSYSTDDLYVNNNGFRDIHDESSTTNGLQCVSDTKYLQMARKGGGHSDMLTIEAHTPTPQPVEYEKKDGQWYAHNGVDVKDTQQRKEMMTVSSRLSNLETSVDIDTDTDYLKIAKKGGGHKDLLEITPHKPSSEPVKCDKQDGTWYTHNGVDIQDTLQRKEMMTVSSKSSSLDNTLDIKTDTDYLKIAKKGGGHQDLLTVTPHTPSPEKMLFDKKDGQWYAHDGVDIQETQQKKSLSVENNGSAVDDKSITAAGGRPTEYLDLAKKGGGHRDLLIVEDHSPSPEPQKYKKYGGEWYNQDDMVIKDGPQDTGNIKKRRRTYSDSAAESKAETEYLRTARRGGGHKDLLIIEPHMSSPEPVKYDMKDGQWYTHVGVDVKETQGRKEMVTMPNSPRLSNIDNPVVDIETDTDYLKVAKKGGGHKDLLIVEPHTPTPEPMKYDRKDGQWYTHDGVDIKETQSRKDLSVSINSCQIGDDVIGAGQNGSEYLNLAKKGGGHKDLLTVEPHTPTPEPLSFDKKDGQWYTHDGVDIKETQSRKDLSVSINNSQNEEEIVAAGQSGSEYLHLAKKGGSHKDLLMIEPHNPTPEPIAYDKKDGQWYAHDGVDVKETQQRKEMLTVDSSPRPSNLDSSTEIEADTEYLKIAKKGGGHTDLLTIEHHTPTHEPIRYEKTEGQWYTHDGVDIKETQSRKDVAVPMEEKRMCDSQVAAGRNNSDYLEVAKKGGGHKDLLSIEPHTPTPEPLNYDKTDGKWYSHDGVDIKETQSRKDLLGTPESIPENLTAAGERNGEYLEVAMRGGRKDLLTVEPHTPTPDPVEYDKKDGQWYTHDGVDVAETQSRKEMVTVASSPRPLSAVEINTETKYLKIAKKGGGHKDLLAMEPHKPTPEPAKFDKKDGQWYTHDGVDVGETQARKEMVTVCSSPRSPNITSSVDVEKETAYLKMAKKGGGHKDLFVVEPHTPKSEPVKYEKKDGKWYTHDGIDVRETQQRKDLLTIQPHTPSPEPKKYQRNGGDWYNQDTKETNDSSPRSVSRQSHSNDTQYLKLARKGGGHSDLLTVTPHTPSTEPIRYDKKDGQWYSHDSVDAKETPRQKGKLNRSPRKNTSSSKFGVNTNTDYLKIARKGGGHKDLLSLESHTPSLDWKRHETKSGDIHKQHNVDGNIPKGKKGADSSPREINTDTEYLRTARKGGGHKDLLTVEHHKPSAKPKKQERKLGDWYYHNDSVSKDSSTPTSSPRKSKHNDPSETEYLRMAKKGGGHKDLLAVTAQSTFPRPRDQQRNGDATPVSSPRNAYTRDATDYLRISRKGGGNPDPIDQVSPLRRSASMRYSSRNTVPDYLSMARKGGHHKDLLTMPESEASNFKRDQASRRSLRSFRSTVTTHVDGPSRPKTADPSQSQPIWLGGSGPERVHTPGKKFINRSSGVAPFAYHEGSPGAAKNPDKI
ncbi:uncharacterized protein [Montipora foliosa]|uniref:uncharacterized protein isoform X4 n=1 Tax=Montipora foliosa TaxID=591990 RepID=UPI0035F1592C